MYETYGDLAEFYVVYIREAHAADSPWPIPIKGEKEKIYQPKTIDQRRKVASRCMTKLSIKMPCLVDTLDNKVEKAYQAWPDRVFVVDTDGKLVVRADPGPWGFGAAVRETEKWLAERFPQRAAATRSQDGESAGKGK